MTQAIKFHDHPDFVGGWKWTELEIRWIEQKIKEAVLEEREACHALRQTLPNPHANCQVSAHAYDMALVAYGKAIRERGEA